MRKPRFRRFFLAALLVLAGCQLMYRYRPAPVLVRDAETKKPLAGAKVHLFYPLSRDSLAPFDSSETTGEDGVARLRAAAPFGTLGINVEATATGYAPGQISLSSESIQKLEPTHLFETAERRKPEFVIEMYAEPRFAVELVVPAGYRGRIKLESQFEDGIPAPPGQRCYRYTVKDGYVRIKGPGVLRRVYPSDYRASYSDGSPLTSEMSLTKVGFRWLRAEGEAQIFVVGTQSEYDMQRRAAPDERTVASPSPSLSTSPRGGGRHRE
jgi:hypothetical protein